MPIEYSTDTLTFGGDVKLDQINEILAARGFGRPLEDQYTAGSRLVATVTGATAETVRAEILDAGAADDVRLDPVLFNGTFTLMGRDIPHAAFDPVLTDPEQTPAEPPWVAPPAGTRRPLIALLDSGVRDHDWLPDQVTDDPFLLDAEALPAAERWDPKSARVAADNPQAGHATFIAGLIRMAAPTARVLSVRVMGADGLVKESVVIDALRWLRGYRSPWGPVDVACMAFGRRPGDASDQVTLKILEKEVDEVARAGIQLVASAGNFHSDEKIFPAAWENVRAVGAGIDQHYHARFSSFGDWVDEYREGVEVLSILPGQRWARWSGTSFSAATAAGYLARSHVD